MVDIYEVDVSTEAKEMMVDIYEYLSDNVSEITAHDVVMGIADAIESLEKFPTGSPIQHNISSEQRTFRFLLKWKYKIIFYVDEDAKVVRVVAVGHSSQNPDNLKSIIK